MASSYKGLDLFGSGSHRFALGRQGQFVVADFGLGGYTTDSLYLGLVELDVVVRGRLVAATEAGLWSLRDAVTAQLLNPPAAGALVDLHGRTWADMSFIRFEESDRVDRGRAWSVGYDALFRRFNQTP